MIDNVVQQLEDGIQFGAWKDDFTTKYRGVNFYTTRASVGKNVANIAEPAAMTK